MKINAWAASTTVPMDDNDRLKPMADSRGRKRVKNVCFVRIRIGNQTFDGTTQYASMAGASKAAKRIMEKFNEN